MTTYCVVIEGTTLPGYSRDDACKALTALIKRDQEAAERLLSGHSIQVQRRRQQCNRGTIR